MNRSSSYICTLTRTGSSTFEISRTSTLVMEAELSHFCWNQLLTVVALNFTERRQNAALAAALSGAEQPLNSNNRSASAIFVHN